MKTAQLETCQAEAFELPAPLTFHNIFQSCPYWAGVRGDFIPQVQKLLRKTPHKQSYLLQLGERQLVLSIAEGAPPFFDFRRQAINSIIEHVSQAGIGPELVFNSPTKGFVVAEYIAGRCWAKTDFQQLGNIERLVELLKQLHGLPQEGPEFFALNAEQRYWSDIRCELMPTPKRLHALQLRMLKIIGYAQGKYQSRVVCHNHLLASQVLETDTGLRLVGWETAAINEPYYDLAVVAHNHQLNEAQIDHLLRCYAGSAGADEREHFYYSYAIYIYLEALRCRVEADHYLSRAQEQLIEAHVDTLLSVLHRLGV